MADNKFLVITSTLTVYTRTGTEAALAAGKPQWDTMGAAAAINALAVGDELDLDADTSVIRLSGINTEYKP